MTARGGLGGGELLGVRILVVDDSEINLIIAKRILETGGACVSLASNGLEAVERLRTDPRAFDVVLMDLHMPVLGGREATSCIRCELGLATLPILALTADTQTSERQQAEIAGMNGVIGKPFDPPELVRSIRRCLHPAPRPDVELPLARPIVSAPAKLPWPEIMGIDADESHRRALGQRELFESMLECIVRDFADVSVLLRTDAPDVLAAHGGRLHRLRGLAGQLGARAIQELASDAEEACSKFDVERATHLTHRLTAELEPLLESAIRYLDSKRVAAPAPSGGGGAAS